MKKAQKFVESYFHYSSMRQPIIYSIFIVVIALSVTGAMFEQNNDYQFASNINPVDIVWVLVSGMLVLFMTPGVAFFYGGMVKHDSFISTMMQSFVSMGVITFLWICFGLSMSFGTHSLGGIVGNPFGHFMLWNVDTNAPSTLAPTLPYNAVAAFELTFAIITPTLISGAIAQRVKFPSWVIFISLWHLLVYCPLAHMIWNPKGILRNLGTQDFAGGIVVEMGSGVSSLVAAWYIGPRKFVPVDGNETAGIEHTLLGTGILWFGWLGFNAGSSYTVDGVACQAFLTTNAAAATGMLVWMLLEISQCNTSSVKISVVGLCNGIVAGMVAITPACGYVTLGGAFCIGICGSVTCFTACKIFHKVDIDDMLEVFCIHGVGGIVGTILTGVFSSKNVNPNAVNGLIYGNGRLLCNQLVALVILIPVVAGLTYLCLLIADTIVPLRVGETTEQNGLDVDCLGSKVTESIKTLDQEGPARLPGMNFVPLENTCEIEMNPLQYSNV